MLKNSLAFFALAVFALGVHAQSYSIVIKGGRVIDPKNNIDAIMDVAIDSGRIVKVAKSVDSKGALQVIDAKGLVVTPGLIDIHGHVFAGTEHYLSNGPVALPPDGFTFRVGVTTIVDCGGAGWKSFPLFKKNIIDLSSTRVLSFLNIVGEGMRGGQYEQDTSDMDSKLAAGVARRWSQYVVGFKVAHFEGASWFPVDHAVEAGRLANMPVIVDFGVSTPPLSIEDLFMKHLRPGDIYTHAFTKLEGNVRETIVDETTNKVKPFVFAAQKRGIIFDVGYGGASFNYSQAIPALKNGFFPNTISTDLHTGSMNASMKDLLSLMSRFMAMGMDLPAVVKATTSNAAKAIKREELGNLSVGSVADVAIFNIREGKFGFWDKTGYKMPATKKLECEVTIREGRIVYDLDGLAEPVVVPYRRRRN